VRHGVTRLALLALVVLGGRATARADDLAEGRPLHGSLGIGGAFVLTGDTGDRNRYDLVADVEPWSRYGAIAAWRGFDSHHDGLAMAGLVFEAAASRPRLVVDLLAEVGADLDARAPLVGGGLRGTLTIVGPLGLAFESGAYLVIDGVADTRLQLQTNALVVVRW